MEMDDEKLNELAATEILGWGLITYDNGKYAHWDTGESGGQVIWKNQFDPCDDWRDMQVLIKLLEETGCSVHIIWCDKAHVEIRRKKTFSYVGGWSDVKAGRAVCLAALKAKGVNVDDE